MNFIKSIYKKYNTFILYAIYGIPPTVFSFSLYLFLTFIIGIPASVSNSIAWFIGVIISFYLYRKFVFKVINKEKKQILLDFLKFISLRLFSGITETCIILLFVDIIGFNGFLFKIIASLTSALLNYFVSKIFIFRNKKKK